MDGRVGEPAALRSLVGQVGDQPVDLPGADLDQPPIPQDRDRVPLKIAPVLRPRCLWVPFASGGALSRGSEGITLGRDELVFRDTPTARHRHRLEAIEVPLARFVGPDDLARPLATLARGIGLLHGQIPLIRKGAVQGGCRQWHACSLDGQVNSPGARRGTLPGGGLHSQQRARWQRRAPR